MQLLLKSESGLEEANFSWGLWQKLSFPKIAKIYSGKLQKIEYVVVPLAPHPPTTPVLPP